MRDPTSKLRPDLSHFFLNWNLTQTLESRSDFQLGMRPRHLTRIRYLNFDLTPTPK